MTTIAAELVEQFETYTEGVFIATPEQYEEREEGVCFWFEDGSAILVTDDNISIWMDEGMEGYAESKAYLQKWRDQTQYLLPELEEEE